ncbi:hybrid sensor histidine kinase/response regulator [Leptolyngbya sp. AN02str]|uniref:hybrid sensor histidine kinase/response regulator n=1 Tax=Leptolyngbya sp. AN02str TaxID=3423363 RepID=UPI003D30FC90
MRQAKQSILVIEDESSIRDIITEMLEDEDFQVTCAEDGQQGLELVQHHIPDLIICDIMMPRMQGYDVLSNLRSDEQTSIIPFVFLTAKADKVNLRTGMDLGADDYLTKPFTRSELIFAVKSRLERQAGLNKHYNQQLEELRKGISSSMPQELISPINGLVGLSEYLAAKYNSISADELLEIAQLINKSAWRFDRVVQNTLLYTKLALAETPMTPEDLQESCDYSLLTVKDSAIKAAQAVNRTADLQFELEDIHVLISMKNLQKIVEELVDNACKFSSAGTPIQISTRLCNEYFTLQVRDQGCGMKSVKVTDIGAYKKFNDEFSNGSGLGLIIVQQLIQLHRGEFAMESAPGAGTLVEVKLPTVDHRVN